jgi:hypothetical protein
MMNLVRLQVPMAASMKLTVFWAVVPCSLVSIIRVIIALMMEAVSTSETLVNLYQTTWHNIPEDSHLKDDTLKHLNWLVI